MNKILITGGCSFSECSPGHVETWPKHLAKLLPTYLHVPTGMGSQGNGLISRKIIYEVQQHLLNGVDTDNILVCIMWSGCNRYDSYFSSSNPEYSQNYSGWTENPTKFVKEHDHKNWYIFNHHWQTRTNKIYYKELFDEVMSKIQTLEHILRVQWFLKLHNIKYMMTTYMANVLDNIDHPECRYLFEMIDKSNFLSIDGHFEWCRDHSMHPFNKNDNHPNSGQHGRFVRQVLYPWLIDKKYLDV